MSATAIASSFSHPTSLSRPSRYSSAMSIASSCGFSLKPSSLRGFRFPDGSFRSTRRASSASTTVSKRFSILAEWQQCKARKEVDVPASVAYDLYSDRESIPRWMIFISSVEVLKDKPHLSRWSLKYKAFGQDIEYSWLARNLQPIPNQKIHWRSLEGLTNRGTVRFFPRGPSSCTVELTFEYEVPPLLVPVASALQPFMEGLIRNSLDRFADLVKTV